jgi:hypothetical protein
MAKKRTRKKASRWKSHPKDAIYLATFRWWALSLERAAIEVYATNPDSYEAIEEVFRQAGAAFQGLRPRAEAVEGDCPPGWYLCKDGLCAPMCDAVIDPDA